MSKKYIGYCRVSTQEQALEGYGLDVQQAKIKAYGDFMNIFIEEIITDEGKSGASMQREGVQRVIELMETGEYAGIVTYKLDRISRNLKDILILLNEILVPNGAKILSVTEQFDTDSAIGKLFLQMLGGFAEFERELIRERMTGGKQEKAKQGKFTGGSAPYGYTLEDGKLVIIASEADAVKKVFAMREQGATLQAIADELNQKGVPTKRGGIWARPHIKKMLEREEFYKGIYKHGSIQAQGEHEPIL